MARPTGVTIIAFFNFAAGGIFIVAGSLALITFAMGASGLSIGRALMLFVLYWVLGALGGVIGIGLWKCKKWVCSQPLLVVPLGLTATFELLIASPGAIAPFFGAINMGLLLYLPRPKVKQAFGFEPQESVFSKASLPTLK